MSIKERKFSEKSTLISVTDVKGVIQYCNSDFIEISGFTEGELLNSHHNIVRHPDMPKAAFEDLWTTIQKDKPWQGMVKNKCKNGDYYWVHAYVTPIFEKGVKTGYQSVRSCPTQQQISDAELLYNSLNSNPAKKLPKPPFLKRIKLAAKINIILLMLTSLFLYEQISAKQFFTIDPEYLVFNLGFVILVGLLVYMINVEVVKRVNALTKTLRTISSGDLNENIELDKFDEIGSTIMSSKMLQGRLKAIIGRFTESTQSLGLAIDVLSESGYQTKVNMDKQHLETEMVATAMNEMSATVTEIAQNTTRTSD